MNIGSVKEITRLLILSELWPIFLFVPLYGRGHPREMVICGEACKGALTRQTTVEKLELACVNFAKTVDKQVSKPAITNN